jgi:hypothetical protein
MPWRRSTSGASVSLVGGSTSAWRRRDTGCGTGTWSGSCRRSSAGGWRRRRWPRLRSLRRSGTRGSACRSAPTGRHRRSRPPSISPPWGWRKGLKAGPSFDTKWYLEQHPELAPRDLNPLIHFVKVGALTGQRPKPKVDVATYLERNPAAMRRPVTMVDIVLSRKGKRGKKQGKPSEAPKPPG